MKISVFGMGYVGCVTGACFAEMGNAVIGVDLNQTKIDMINSGKSPIIEEGLGEMIDRLVKAGKFAGTTDVARAVEDTELALICVGTPSRHNGSIDLRYVARVAEQIGAVLRRQDRYYVVGVRSTVFPGSVEEVVIPAIEKTSLKKAGKEFGVCMIPEFLREGSSIRDFFNPPKNVIGELDARSGEAVASLFAVVEAPLIRTDLRTAEMVKYADNSFHALKVTFANEIGLICKELAIDSHRVMDIFCKDVKLNLSPYYLKPGFAFGGSCLPKDLRALTHEAKMRDADVPLLGAILESNKRQVLRVVRMLAEFKGKRLGFMGLSFKGGTDDLRESPLVDVIETMIGKGFSIRIYDRFVSLARLTGSNKEYIEREIPHVSSLMCDTAADLIDNSDVIVVGNHSEEFRAALLAQGREDQTIVDLVRISGDGGDLKPKYQGVCW